MRSSWRRSWSGEVRCWTSRWPGAASTTRRAVVRIDASRAALRPPVSPSRSNPTSLWPAVTLSRMSAQVPVITSSWTLGHRSRRAARRAGSTYALSDSTAATISVAFTSVDTRARSARSWLVSVTMFRARGSKASPVGVKLAPRAAFRKRAVPTARSSELSVSETVDCETPSDRAARVWPPSWATARKTRRWRSSSSGFTPTSYHRRGRYVPSALWTAEPERGGSASMGSPLNPEVLLVLDVQQGFDAPTWGRRNNPEMEERVAELLDAWRSTSRPVIHLKHMSTEPGSPLRPDQPGNAFKAEAAPRSGERVI